MKKKTALSVLSVVLLLVFLLSGGFTLASWRARGYAINKIGMGNLAGHIINLYEREQDLFPGDKISKTVQVQNVGTVDAVVRVKVEKVWGSSRDEDGKLVVDRSLSTDNIILSYNTDDWIDKGDGYFYFKGVLRPGETTPNLLDSFTVDGKTTTGIYQNKSADIVVTMEMVQAAYHGLSYWGTTFAELGLTYTRTEEVKAVTTVDFNSPTEGFSFISNDRDLFSNFKNLVPGDSRSQQITVTNDWDKKTEIFLFAELTEQSYATYDNYKYILDLLQEYTTVNITDNLGNVIYSGPVYGNVDVEPTDTNSMKYPISLGKFNADETKKLNVSLYVSNKMDNKYNNLLGEVKWVFSAEGNGNITNDTSSIKTGEEIFLLLCTSLTFISALMLIILMLKRRKNRDSE